GRLADLMALERLLVEGIGIDLDGDRRGLERAAQVVAGGEHPLGHRPVKQTGVQMAQAVMGGDALGDGALAGCGRSVDGDDHDSSPPRRRIMSTKPGKLVAMKAVSSTCTGSSAPSPITRAAMAMRWSMWVATRPPPGTPPRPATIMSSPA